MNLKQRLMNVLLAPLVTEKSTRVAGDNRQFVFRVARDAVKPSIKQAVEQMFDVKVVAVRVCNVVGKKKRFQAIQGRRRNWKKAYVTLEKGCDIDFTGVI